MHGMGASRYENQIKLTGLPASGMSAALIGSWRHCCNPINAETFQPSEDRYLRVRHLGQNGM
jgi:hypothetical protein